MSAPSWPELEALFHEALTRAPAERAAFLGERCAGRPDLHAEVEALLRAHERTASALEVPLPSQARLKAGMRLGSYEVLSELGAGSMGEVYRARDTRLGRDVAIKVLPALFLSDPARRARFEREARVLASLNHPHILTVHDAGQLDGRRYLVSELIDGGTLRDWVRDTRPTWRQTLELLTGVADGLACAHEAGILHRDIKPDNILVIKSGYAKVADFGLAKMTSAPERDVIGAPAADHTRAGAILGTIAYMSPEQASGKPIDARSDIFAFGAVLFEMLAGRHPFEGTSDVERLHAIVHHPAPSLGELCTDLPVGVRLVVERTLEKNPAARYQTMREMVADLRRLTRQTTEAITSAAVHRKREWKRVAVFGILVSMVAAGVWFTNLAGLRSRSEPTLTYTPITNFTDSAVAPALSSDGRMLAFIRSDNWFLSPDQIWVKLLPNGEPVQLTNLPGSMCCLSFSPDGSWPSPLQRHQGAERGGERSPSPRWAAIHV